MNLDTCKLELESTWYLLIYFIWFIVLITTFQVDYTNIIPFIYCRQLLYFLFFSVKTLLFPFGPITVGRGHQGVKKLLSGYRGQMPWHLGDTKGSLQVHWVPEALSPAGGWAFTRAASPAQPVEVSQVVAIFLMSFTSSSRKWISRKSEMWVWNAGRADTKWPGSGSSPEPWQLSWRPEFYLIHLGTVSAYPVQGVDRWFCVLNCWHLELFLSKATEKQPTPWRATLSEWKEKPRER